MLLLMQQAEAKNGAYRNTIPPRRNTINNSSDLCESTPVNQSQIPGPLLEHAPLLLAKPGKRTAIPAAVEAFARSLREEDFCDSEINDTISNTNTINTLLTVTQKMTSDGYFYDASVILSTAIELGLRDTPTHLMLTQYYITMGQYDKALQLNSYVLNNKELLGAKEKHLSIANSNIARISQQKESNGPVNTVQSFRKQPNKDIVLQDIKSMSYIYNKAYNIPHSPAILCLRTRFESSKATALENLYSQIKDPLEGNIKMDPNSPTELNRIMNYIEQLMAEIPHNDPYFNAVLHVLYTAKANVATGLLKWQDARKFF